MTPHSGRGVNILLIVGLSAVGAIVLLLMILAIIWVYKWHHYWKKFDRPASATPRLEAGLVPPKGQNHPGAQLPPATCQIEDESNPGDQPVVQVTTGSRRLANFIPFGSFPPERVRFTSKLAAIPEETEAELLAEGELKSSASLWTTTSSDEVSSGQSTPPGSPIGTQLHRIGAGDCGDFPYQLEEILLVRSGLQSFFYAKSGTHLIALRINNPG